MKNIVFLITLSCMMLFAKAQIFEYGVANGASYTPDYQRKLENARENERLDRQAYFDYVEKVKVKYKNLQSLYKYQTRPYATISDGWKFVLATNGYDLYAMRNVYVEKGVVTKYLNGNNQEVAITSGGKIIDEKTVIAVNANESVVELYFGYKLN